MELLEKEIKNLKKRDLHEINLENFLSPADEDRYYNFLYNYVLSSVTDDSVVFDKIEEKKFYNPNYRITGVFETSTGYKCIVPERETLFDEMVSIHEITHLINILNSRNNDKSIYREVIPFFNEYEYLEQIHSFFSTYYERFRENKSIETARLIDNLEKYTVDKETHNYRERIKNCKSYILAYEILKKRKNNYNIDKLNRINAKTLTLEKDLKRKGYTI